MHTKKVIKFPSSTESIGRPIFCFRMNKIVAANPNPAIRAAIFPHNSVKDNSSKKKSPKPNSIMKIVIQSIVLDFSPRNEKLKIATKTGAVYWIKIAFPDVVILFARTKNMTIIA